MEEIFYVFGGAGLPNVNEVLRSGGTVKMISSAGGDEGAEAYIVVELPPQADQ